MVSATVLWLLSGLAQPLPTTVGWAMVLGFAAMAVLRDTKVISFWLPQNSRQVPQEVLYRGMRSGALQFGFEMGTGVRTYVSASAPYVVAVALLLTRPSLAMALATGVGFGTGRATTALLRVASGLSIDAWNARLRVRLRWLVPGSALAVFGVLAISAWT